MTTDFMLALAKSLEQCPKCHKTTLNEFSKLDISSSKIYRTCQCGYSIEIDIKENVTNPDQEKKILLENNINQTNKQQITEINESKQLQKK